MAIKVFIDGAAGTTGLQIRDRMAAETQFEVVQLEGEDRKSPEARARALNSADFAILCLPDAAAREAVQMIDSDVRVIDASSAHRTSKEWVYGLPELSAEQAEAIRGAKLVSNPGCYPTGAILLMRPLVDAGILPPSFPAPVVAVSGYSGAGNSLIKEYEDARASGADIAPLRGYALTMGHKHLPEMQAYSGLASAPNFMPMVGAYAQGILLYIPFHASALARPASKDDLHAVLSRHYQDSPFISVQPLIEAGSTEYLRPDALNNTNKVHLYVLSNADESQFTLAAVYDNLGKGASGAALQNLKLMAGV
ncbi:N-acetyl-gamma-glutamyl-phosphate reductase [Allopusillimonas soli]|uniref:N-acetyl-gamma-glutamyl-phosphate reductase n=1 Tax=Allopusillimonas soli TaxID=659016 RepID=A0A853F831_9BURK|nr:N-acetyl-gamma-glutamyl-phosphate reductase [Allopusillimonas soli]NYT35702.1 N-acetyl-gamma-glutamyl-phosphate reductase [Allopusillimonas soli]TEA76093.1 N-acetyl-gamma-glutamyl-phosphate reductase [Allopusillimonas soli]